VPTPSRQVFTPSVKTGITPQDIAPYEIANPPTVQLQVGEGIGSEVLDAPGIEFTKIQWTIAGNPIANYDFVNGRVTPLVLNRQWIEHANEWYWTAPGTYTIRIDTEAIVTIDEVPIPGAVSAICIATVTAPTFVSALTMASEVKVQTIMDYVVFGTLPDAAGYQMCWIVQAAGAGRVTCVQLVRSRRSITHSAGAPVVLLDTHDQYWLDTEVPYDEVVGLPGGQLLYTTSDSPTQEYDPSDNFIDINESFKMYVMWQSATPQSIWVTLGVVHWFWNTQVLKNPDGIFTILEQDYSNRLFPHKTERSLPAGHELPVWNGQVAQIVQAPIYPPRYSVGPDLLMMFQYDGSSETTRAIEQRIGRKMGTPRFDYTRPNYGTMNCGVSWVSQAAAQQAASVPGVFQVMPMPLDAKLSDRCKGSAPVGTRIVVNVAPLSFPDFDYWRQYAHAPIVFDGRPYGADTSMAKVVADLARSAQCDREPEPDADRSR
jgi:hypothetical protein